MDTPSRHACRSANRVLGDHRLLRDRKLASTGCPDGGHIVSLELRARRRMLKPYSPGKAADASAARNACQCILGAAASAAIEPMIQSMGIGWSYTTLAAIFLTSSTSLIFCMRHGIEWRVARAAREKVREEKRKASEQFRSS